MLCQVGKTSKATWKNLTFLSAEFNISDRDDVWRTNSWKSIQWLWRYLWLPTVKPWHKACIIRSHLVKTKAFENSAKYNMQPRMSSRSRAAQTLSHTLFYTFSYVKSVVSKRLSSSHARMAVSVTHSIIKGQKWTAPDNSLHVMYTKQYTNWIKSFYGPTQQ